MRRSANSLIALLLVALLPAFSACREEPVEIKTLQDSLCAENARDHFPALSAQPMALNHPVNLRYGGACDTLNALQGLKIKGYDGVFLCRSFLPAPDPAIPSDTPGPAKKRERILALFGDPIRWDILTVSRFSGQHFAALILTDEGGNPARTLLTQRELSTLSPQIASAAAAAAWAYLRGELGEGYQPQALCEASLTESGKGWQFANADIFFNCQPRLIRTVQLSRKGQITILSEQEKKDAEGNSPILCID